MIKKFMNRLVGFQNDVVEDINWKRVWSQLKWMNTFSRGYRGRIGVLTGFAIFFVLLGVAYAKFYGNLVNQIYSEGMNILARIQGLGAEAQGLTIFEKFELIFRTVAKFIQIDMIWIALAYIVYKFLMYCYSLFNEFFTLRLSTDLGLGIKRKVYATILESDWLSLTQYRAGDLVQRVSGDADTISSFAMSTVPGLIVQAVQFVAAFWTIASMDWMMTALAFVSVPMYLLVIRIKGKRTRDYSKRSLELGSKNSSFLYETMANIMVIKSFMLVVQFIGRYRKIHQEMYDLALEQKKYGIVTGAIIGMVSRVVTLLITAFIILRMLDGKLTIGDLMTFSMLAGMVSAPITSVMGVVMSSISITASAERVQTIYDLPRDKTQVPEAVSEFAKKVDADGLGLSVDNLAFAYVKGEKVLHDVNITVNPGETVALVGPSGEGKTTLIRLALGLLTPDAGRAYLKTGKGETLDLSVETREFFSYVPQGNTMFSGTIRENMQMGDPAADAPRIRKALESACLWSFVETLPSGLDTVIGERGVGLSEGQAQRLAIARALLRGAPILLLDEATSALDIYTEKEVLDNIFQSGICKTCVLTTHRPSVFTVCDKIYRVRQRSVELIKATRDQQVEF